MTAPSPAKGPPQRVTLEGRYVRLEPIGPQHAADLFRAATEAGAEGRFDYLFEFRPADEAEMAAYVRKVMASNDPLLFAVVDKSTGRAEGRQALMRIVPEHGVIEIGSIYWGPRMARSRLATEALFLHAKYVFETLGYRRFEWKCNDRNAPSQAAARRFGFQFEGVFRQHMIQKGENRDTAWFAMTDGDWPALKAEYERWLAPDNFDAAGQQKSKLRFA
jgi:RimJ/RimL family protein N-acetyltransferase